MSKPAAMRAPSSLRERPGEVTIERRTFTHRGYTYDVRAEKIDSGWAVAAYLDGRRASRGYTFETNEGEIPSPETIARLGELMIDAEDDVARTDEG